MPRLVHLSDLHLQLDWRGRSWFETGWRGAPGRFELQGLNRLERFEQARERIARLVEAALEREPDQVLLTGDLTALGVEAELTQVRGLLEPLISRGRLVVIPGNHDRYTDAPHVRGFERVFSDLLASDLPEYADEHGWPFVKLRGADFAIIGIDSTRVSGWSHYFVGRVGVAQRAALGRLLDDPRLAKRTVLVLVHHGPKGPSGQFDWRESGLLDAAQLSKVLEGRRVVLLHGHSHHRYWHRAANGAPHQLGGGSSTEDERAGFWEVELADHHVVEARAHELEPLRTRTRPR